MQQQTHEVLTNGLGSFAQVSPDYELAPVGLASMRQQAQRLAEHGRNGDIYVVHAAEGETVIPVEVLDANPMVKELLFEQMRDMGLDPGRYMVGNDLNSLNPETGMPEFFFKSIFKGIGKVIKKVVKVVKKVAPIVLPIAAAAFGIPFLGPAFGAGTFGASFVGSGIGSLLGGDSIGTAFKKAVIGGGLASLGGFAKGALSPTGTALGGLEGSFTGSTPVFGAPGTEFAGQRIGENVAASPFGEKSIFGASDASRAGGEASNVQFDKIKQGDFFEGATQGLTGETGEGAPGFLKNPNINLANSNAMVLPDRVPTPEPGGTSSTQDGFFDKVGDYMFRGGDTKAAIDARMDAAGQRYLESTLKGVRTPAAYEAARNAAGPGMLAKFGPSVALGLGATYFGGGFETGKTGESPEARKAYDERFNQFKYGTGLNQVYNNNEDNFGVKLYSEGFQPRNKEGLPVYDLYGRPIMRAAAGGATFDPFNYTGTPLNREYTPPIQYQDSRNIFNPNFSPPPAPVPTYLGFRSSYAPLDVDPYYQSGYTPTASDPNAPPVDLFKPFDPSLDETTGVATDETATSGIASIPEPVKPLFFLEEQPDDEDDDDHTGTEEDQSAGYSFDAETGGEAEANAVAQAEAEEAQAQADAEAAEAEASAQAAEAEADGNESQDASEDNENDDDNNENGTENDDDGEADGGYIGTEFRPRAQMLVEGPGTERSDDIPAMLSDGEFVLNARSVRGADPTGQGNRYLGAQNLYRMMRDFEMRA